MSSLKQMALWPRYMRLACAALLAALLLALALMLVQSVATLAQPWAAGLLTSRLVFSQGFGDLLWLLFVLVAAQAALARYITEHKQLGHDITLSGLYACLHQSGVQKVALASPLADIVIAPSEAAHCTGVQIDLGVTDV